MKEKSLKKNYIFNLIYNMTNLLVPLFLAPYLSRILQADGVGIKSYTLSIVSNFTLFATLGMAEYGQREISRNRDNKYNISKKIYEIGLLRIITTCIVLMVYIPVFILGNSNNNYMMIYVILLINVLSNALDFAWFLRGVEDFKSIAVVQMMSKIGLLVATILFVKNKDDLSISILFNSLSLLINSVLSVVLVKKYCVKVKLKEIKPFIHLKECLVYFVPAIAIQIYTVLDKVMIGVITQSNYENGYYEQSDKIVKILLTLVTTANTIMNSRISYLYSKNEMQEIIKLNKKSISLCMLVAMPITFGIIGVSDIFVPIFFGSGYEKTTTLLIILAPLTIIIGISGLLGSHYYTPMGKKRSSNKYLIIGAVINFVLNIILIKVLNSIGAAIASLIAESVITILYFANSDKKLFNIKELLNASYKYFIAAIVMFFIIFFIKPIFKANIISLIILIAIGVCVYFSIIIVLKDKYVFELLNQLKDKMGCKKGKHYETKH